jgi:cyclic pyranopterin phosphate synthase
MTSRQPLSLVGQPEAGRLLTRPESAKLIDSFGRFHDNLRVSVTDRCNLRCTYCMPEDVTFRPKDELLTFEEITHFVRVAAGLGVSKVRLTGGEPLLRRDLHVLVQMLVGIPGLADIGLTTNGLLLASQAQRLHDAGLRRLNVSLDTLDPGRFRALARRDGLEHVVEGLLAARRVGFEKIKVNAIAIRGSTEEDIVPLAKFSREHGFDLRFIEYMPIGAEAWERDKVLLASDILETLEAQFGPLTAAEHDPHAPAMEFAYTDGRGTVGVIASVSRPFCRQCNRVRLTAEGKLRNCLFALDETDVKPLLRGESDDARLAELIRDSVWEKWEGHEINSARFVKPERTMHAIGG